MVSFFVFRAGILSTHTRLNAEGARRRVVAFSRPYGVLNPHGDCAFASPYFGFGFTTLRYYMRVYERGEFDSYLERAISCASYVSTGQNRNVAA